MGNGVRKVKNIRYNNNNENVMKTSETEEFLKEISGTLSYDEAFPKLPRAVYYLKQYKTLDSTDARRLLVFLRMFSGPLKTTTAEQRLRWVEQLLNENVLSMCLNFWRLSFGPRLFTKSKEEEMRNFRNLIGILWNSTEISQPCCLNVCDNGGLKLLLDTMNADCLNDAKLKQQDMSNINRVYVSHSSGAIAKNILCSYPEGKKFFRQADGIKISQKLMNFSSDIIKSTAAMLLAYGVNDDEYYLITSPDELLSYEIRLLNECVKDSGHHSVFSSLDMLDAIKKLAENDENKLHLVKLGVLAPLEKLMVQPLNDAELNATIKCIWVLAFADGNKNAINENSVIIQKLQACLEHQDPEIVKKAKGALWILKKMPPVDEEENSGDEDEEENSDGEDDQDEKAAMDSPRDLDFGGPIAKGPLGPPAEQKPIQNSSESGLLEKLSRGFLRRSKKMKESGPPALAAADEGTSPKLSKSKKKSLNKEDNKSPRRSNKNTHIMISYQWNYKPLILRINDELKSKGYKVWVDVEQMSGSTLEAMAEAIENAWLVLICLSESYKQSPSCRTEAEYTYKMRKDFIPLQLEEHYKPTGWLGILIGTKLYFNMASENNIASNIQSLLREISIRRVPTATSSPPLTKSINLEGSQTTPRAPIQATESQLSKWTEQDVQKWLTENQLETLSSTFTKFDGPLLLGLKKIYFKAPLIYYSTLKNDLNVNDLHVLIKFTNALENV